MYYFLLSFARNTACLTVWCAKIRWAHTLRNTFSCNEWSSKSMYVRCYGQCKYKIVTANLLHHYWALSRHLPTDTTVVLYAQYIIANHMVNKPPSVGATKRNNITKRTSAKAPTNSNLSQQTLFCYCITYHVFRWFQYLIFTYML